MGRRIFLYLMLFSFSLPLWAAGKMVRTTDRKEKILIAGCGWNRVAILDKESEKLIWEHPLEKGDDCNDIELTKQGQVLYAYTGGARLVTLDQNVVWDYKVAPGEELFTATQLPGGKFLLGICGHPARILELDKRGKVVDEFTFETGISVVHHQFRQLLKTKQGTYIIPLFGSGEVIEMERNGTVLRRIKTGGNPFSVKLSRNGSWMVGCGDAHKWVEIDPVVGQIVRTVGGSLPGCSLLYVAELHLYPNNHVLVANWNGHSNDKTQPKMIEVDGDGRVVWCLKNDQGIKNVSAVYPFYKLPVSRSKKKFQERRSEHQE